MIETPDRPAKVQIRAQRPTDRRGLMWIIGAFAICPCHLPLTLGILATLLGGTAAGAALQQYPFVAGAIIAIAWAIGTWRGFRLLRAPRACPVK